MEPMNEIALDPEGFDRRLSQYVEWLRVNHFSEETAFERRRRLAHFIAWAADRGLTRPMETTKQVLERYQAALYHYRKKDGEPLSLTSQRNFLTSIKGFFKWLSRSNHILFNPASEILLPRLSRRLPRHVLSAEEAERVLAVPDAKAPLGIRDRAILETCYSTGLRRMELAALKLFDLDRDRGTIFVREGKGRQQRVIPIGERALRWVEKYLQEVRPELVVPPDEGYVFLTHKGGPFEIDSLTEMVRVYVERAQIGKKGSVHLFRHTMATLMLEGGADVRFVQAMLGHRKLETTQIYTQVSIRTLKEVHARTHPARMERKKNFRALPAPATPSPAEASPERDAGARPPRSGPGEPPGGGRAGEQSR
jgi:integrase/recombinase XerD